MYELHENLFRDVAVGPDGQPTTDATRATQGAHHVSYILNGLEQFVSCGFSLPFYSIISESYVDIFCGWSFVFHGTRTWRCF